jgi:hypothetical protein
MLKVIEVARRLRVSRQMVVDLYHSGKLPRAVDWSDKPLFFREEDVQRVMDTYLCTSAWRPRGAHKWPEKRARRAGGTRRG